MRFIECDNSIKVKGNKVFEFKKDYNAEKAEKLKILSKLILYIYFIIQSK